MKCWPCPEHYGLLDLLGTTVSRTIEGRVDEQGAAGGRAPECKLLRQRVHISSALAT